MNKPYNTRQARARWLLFIALTGYLAYLSAHAVMVGWLPLWQVLIVCAVLIALALVAAP